MGCKYPSTWLKADSRQNRTAAVAVAVVCSHSPENYVHVPEQLLVGRTAHVLSGPESQILLLDSYILRIPCSHGKTGYFVCLRHLFKSRPVLKFKEASNVICECAGIYIVHSDHFPLPPPSLF